MSLTNDRKLPLSELTAITAVDGRYARHTSPLRGTVSEYGLIRYRVLIEIAWLRALAAKPEIGGLSAFDEGDVKLLTSLANEFNIDDAERIKSIESSTNHDVKAVEYWLREKLSPSLSAAIPFIHFACTSEDINNLSYSLMLRDARDDIVLPAIQQIAEILRTLAHRHAELPMLSRTHGQSATPTTVGKEFANIVVRLEREIDGFQNQALRGKINGAVGNYNAHMVAYPELDWPTFAAEFVQSLGLEFNAFTTQIEPHDCIADYSHNLIRINTILIDCCRDIWQYISLGYFGQKKIEGEVGSSTMPHKVNPIDFENAEGNLGYASAALEHFARKLPISRLQRDLTDSTVLRNLGTALAHCLIACRSLDKGLNKLEINQAMVAADLENAWEILAEPIQTVMRAEGIADSYEQLKALTRGQTIDRQQLDEFLNTLDISEAAKARLQALTPSSYIGLAAVLARDV